MLDIITMLCGNDFDNIEERIEKLLRECNDENDNSHDFDVNYLGVIELGLDDIIINPPATIVKWDDGTKTVVRCQPNDEYDPEKGIALCFMKKMCDNKSSYNDIIKSAIKEYEERLKKKH